MPRSASQPDDDQLVGQTLAGERDAFAVLFDRYAKLVRAIAWAEGLDWTAVQDLTQECFLRAYRQLSQLRQRGRFRYWLTGIARQLVRESYRRRRHEPLGDRDPVAISEPSALDDRDEIEHVLQLVARLPAQEKRAVRLFFLSDRNIAETAQHLGLSRSGAYEVIKRACARLARWLGVVEAEEGCNHELP